jgi:mycobactin salicyl-AMP ligase
MNQRQKADEQLLRGAWSHLTIGSLVETSLRAKPERRSFSDAPDIADWSDQPGRQTNAGQFGLLVQTFARQIMTLGLRLGDPVIVAMPNQVDGVVALAGLMLAGLVPCPVSVVASPSQMQKAAETVGAKAIITVNRYASLKPSLAAREAASRFYGLRFVCAFGPHAPEGIVSLEGWQDSELWQGAFPGGLPSEAALITLDTSGETIVPHVRTHAQLISEGLALSAISGLTGRGAVIATFAPVSAAGFVSTVAAPLISGTAVSLHGPFDIDVLERQLQAQPEALVVLPASAEIAIRHGLGDRLKDSIVVTRSPGAARPTVKTGRVTELVCLGELALLPLLRDRDRTKQRLPRVYAHPVGTALPAGVAQLELSISTRGRLALQGFGLAQISGAKAAAASVHETRWLAHGDGHDCVILMPEDAEEAETLSLAVAAA